MGFFDHFHKDGTAALKPQTLRTKRTVVRPSAKSSESVAPTTGQTSRAPSHNVLKPLRAVSDEKTDVKARRARKRVSPAQQRLVSSSDESEGDEIETQPRKRARTDHVTVKGGVTRRLRSTYESDNVNGDCFDFVHSADIAALGGSNNYQAVFTDSSNVKITLAYPGGPQKERYQFVLPRDSEDFNPVNDMIRVIELVSSFYLLPDQAEALLDEASGIVRKLRRALSRGSGQEYREGVLEYNEIIRNYQDDGTISKNLDAAHSLPLPIVERILTQTYARTVSLQVNALKKYENGSDNVYGELLPRFISKIFRDTNLRSDQVFVDLGSGVGNVVLQAALEVGCESWGCEMMENACELAERQEKEFIARCRLWGLAIGRVNLEKGDFLKNTDIAKVLKRADVVLVNNQAFTPELNNGLMNLFLDLREGCRIVSLKSFVPPDHKITPRNFNSPVHLLEVEKKEYFSDSVSWTNAPGTYFVARKDSTKLKRFLEKMG